MTGPGVGSLSNPTSSPDTWKLRPFTFAAASVHSQTTNGAILLDGNCAGSKSGRLSTPGSGPIVRVITRVQFPAVFFAYSVVETPVAKGRIALQRTPNLPSSLATVRVSPITPSFAVA